jgi:hypothetical protein
MGTKMDDEHNESRRKHNSEIMQDADDRLWTFKHINYQLDRRRAKETS